MPIYPVAPTSHLGYNPMGVGGHPPRPVDQMVANPTYSANPKYLFYEDKEDPAEMASNMQDYTGGHSNGAFFQKNRNY